MTVISNGTLSAEISIENAELYSLKRGSEEYIWQRDKKFWNRSSPLLFPIVGRQKDDSYSYGGKSYSIGIHGIADSLRTELVEKNESCTVTLSVPTAESKKHYPFSFRIFSRFALSENRLTVSRRIINDSAEEMPFCIGEHPGFICRDAENSLVLFESMENTQRAFLDKSHYIEREEPFHNNKLPVNDRQFANGACILRECSSEYLTVTAPDGRARVRVFPKDYPSVVIWRKRGAEFICIEPVQGFDSDADDSNSLIEKRNHCILKPKEERNFEFAIEPV